MAARESNSLSKANDVDDMDFLKAKPSSYVLDSGSSSSYRSSAADAEYAKRQALLMEKKRLEESTLRSAQASLGLVLESEKMGISTAEELIRQGEKLTNIDSNLDSMNSTMRHTQKHLTSMKSIFGGLKSYFSRSTDVPPNTSASIDTMSKSTSMSNSIARDRPSYNSKLNETIDAVQRQSNSSRSGADSVPSATGSSKKPSARSEFDRKLDENLGELDLGLGRLKNLAIGLGSEIEQQNELLEKIMTKEERAEETMNYQNRQMKQLLKKWLYTQIVYISLF